MGFIASAYSGLFTLLNGNPVFVSYGQNLKVYFGPRGPQDSAKPIEIWVGSAGLAPEEDRAGFDQRWATMGAGGAAQRDKILMIPCAVWAIAGPAGTDPLLVGKARLETAEAVYNLIDGLVKVSDLGMPAVLCGGAEVVAAEPRLVAGPDGAEVHIAFTVRATGRE